MDFTMNMMDSGRGISVSQTQAAALAALGGSVAGYHTTSHQTPHQAHQNVNAAHQSGHHSTAHLISVGPNHQQQVHQTTLSTASQQHQQEHHQQQQHHHHQQQQQQHQQLQQHSLQHEEDHNGSLPNETKPHDLAKDEAEIAFTPPPRVGSVGSVASHPDTRVEKGTDTNDFEPFIKVEIRGHVPGITEKDKNSVLQLHFSSVNEVVHYFSQKTSVPQLDAFINLTNSDLVRNINPDLMRNHFLYVPNGQDGVRLATNGFSTGQINTSQTPPVQVTSGSSIVIAGNSLPTQIPAPPKPRMQKTERRRGEVPPGTIINKTPPIENNPNQFVCWICGLNLQKSLPFEEHMVEQHSIEKPYRCEDCGVTFKQKAHIDRHRRIHLPTRPYQCGVCGKGFTRNEHVRRHSFTHSGEKPYHCPTCNKTFSRQQQLSKHLLSHTKPPRADSPQPGHPHSQEAMRQYEQSYDELCDEDDDDRDAKVNLLGLEVLPPGLTTTLLLQATDANGRLVTLNQPGAQVTVPSSIVAGSQNAMLTQSTHTVGGGSGRGRQPNGEPVARPYQCGVCGKAFIRNEHLRRHMLIHSGEKPHSCGVCGKAFPRREHLTKHMRSHLKEGHVQVTVQSPLSAPQPTHTYSSVTNAHVSLSNSHAVSASGVPTGASVVSSAQQPSAAHSGAVTHSINASHSNSVPHATHLPPGTHYLPMFGLLAEVV